MPYSFKQKTKPYISEENKKKKVSDCPEITELFNQQLNNYKDYVLSKSVYQIGQVCNGIDHYLDDKLYATQDQTHYERGEVLWVDFGCMNLGSDFEFPHPAIVLAETNYHILIAPCSTKKYSHNIPEILKVGEADGLKSATGIMLDSISYVSKNKVINRLDSKVNEKVMLKIDKYRLGNNEYHRRVLNYYARRMKALEDELEKMKNEMRKNGIAQ